MAPKQPFSIKFTSEGLSDVLQASQKVRKSYLEWVESAEDSIKKANALSQKYGATQEELAEAEKLRANAARTANRAIVQSYRELGIKSTASVEEQKEKAISAFEAIAQSGTASADDIERAQDALNKKLSDLDRQLDSTQKEIEETGDAAKDAEGGLGAMDVAIGNLVSVVLTRLIDGLQSAVKWIGNLGRSALDMSADVDSTLRSIGALITGTGRQGVFSTGQLDRFAISLGERTLTSREAVLEASRSLLSFKSVSDEVFFRALEASQDLATVMGTDIRGAARQMALALEDPERGLSALRRSGTTFTDEQKELIKTLAQSGRQLEAQEEILKVIESQYRGAGEAAAGGLAGALDTLGERQRRALISFGDALTPVIQPIIEGATSILEPLINPNIYAPMVDAFQTLFGTIGEIVGETEDWSGLVEGALRGAIEFVAALLLDINQTISENPEIVREIIAQVQLWLEALRIVIQTLALAVAGALKLIPVLIDIKEAIEKGINLYLKIAKETFESIIDPAAKLEELAGNTGKEIGKWFTAIEKAINPLRVFLDITKSIFGQAERVGSDAEQRLGEGGALGTLIPAPGGAFHPDRFPITSSFGMRNGRLHAGTDYGTPQGTQLANIFGTGVVTIAGQAGNYGGLIELTLQNGDVYRFGHMSQISVRAGQVVPPGALLGLTGGEPGTPGAGRSTGPHLHLEYYPGGGGAVNFEARGRGGPLVANNARPFARPGSGGPRRRSRISDADRQKREQEKAKRKAESAARKKETQRRKNLRRDSKLRDAAEKLEDVIEAVETELGLATASPTEIERVEADVKSRFNKTFSSIEKAEAQIQKNIDLKKLEKKSIDDENAALEKLAELREKAAEAQDKEIEKAKELFKVRQEAQRELDRVSRIGELAALDAQISNQRADTLGVRGRFSEFDIQQAQIQSQIVQTQAEFAERLAQLGLERAQTDVPEQVEHIDQLINRYQQLEEVTLDGLRAQIEEVTKAQAEANRILPGSRELFETAFSGLESFAGSLGEIFTGAQDLGEALRNLISQIISDLSRLFLSRAFQQLENLLFGGRRSGGGGLFSGFLGSGTSFTFGSPGTSFTGIGGAATGLFGGSGGGTLLGSTPFGFNRGGLAVGPLGEDRIPARLTAGEYVLQASAVRAIGVEALEYLNSLGNTPSGRGGITNNRSQTVNFNISTPDTGGFRRTQRQLNSQALAELQRFR